MALGLLDRPVGGKRQSPSALVVQRFVASNLRGVVDVAGLADQRRRGTEVQGRMGNPRWLKSDSSTGNSTVWESLLSLWMGPLHDPSTR